MKTLKIIQTCAFLIALIGIVTLVSAIGFDNSKEYNSQERIITITNNFGLGEELAQIKLISEPIVRVIPGEDRKVAEMEFISFKKDYQDALKKIDLYDRNNNDKKFTRQFTYKKKIVGRIDNYPIYEEACVEAKEANCKIVGYNFVQRYDWQEINSIAELSNGDIIGIFTDVYENDYVEWVPTFFDVEINEWALWTDAFNEGLMAYWKFNDVDNPNVNDSLGHTNGTNYNAQRGRTGVINNSIYFDGAGDWIDANETGWTTTNANFTISFWYNSSDYAAEHYPLERREGLDADASRPFDFQTLATPMLRVQISTGGGAAEVRFTTPVAQTIYHVVATKNDSTLTLYIDGARIGNTSVAGAQGDLINPNSDFRFGGGGAGTRKYLQGIVDEIGFWNRSLSASEISDLYNGGSGITWQPMGASAIEVELTLPINGFQTALQTDALAFNATITKIGSGNLTNATLWVWNNTGVFNNTFVQLLHGSTTNVSNMTINITFGTYQWNVWGCANNSDDTLAICDFAPSNFTFTKPIANDINSLFSAKTYQTKKEYFQANVSVAEGFSITSAKLVWNGTERGGNYTLTQDGTQDNYTLAHSFDIPNNVNHSQVFFNWNITFNEGSVSTTNLTNQSVDAIAFNITYQTCGTGQIVPFLNFTYKNETVSQELITAFVSSSTWDYWLGTGSVKKTYTFSDATEETNSTFCFYPPDHTVNTNFTFRYDNTESQQRTYADAISLTNSTTETTLWLLPTNDGIFVTFQILNAADQPLEGAIVTITRSGFGTIAQETTGASGSVTIFLNPNFVYTLTVAKTGFPTFTATQTFTLTEYTINLGTSQTPGTDLTRGITITSLTPKLGETLINGTDYNFSLGLSSSFWTIDSFGFVLQNSTNGTVLASVSSPTTGIVSTVINTGENRSIVMDYFWVINGSYVNSTYIWSVSNLGSGSINGFFVRLREYIGDGIFGIDTFSAAIIFFVLTFILFGVLSAKFGLANPLSIIVSAGVFIILLSILGIFHKNIALLAGLVVLGIILREVTKD